MAGNSIAPFTDICVDIWSVLWGFAERRISLCWPISSFPQRKTWRRLVHCFQAAARLPRMFEEGMLIMRRSNASKLWQTGEGLTHSCLPTYSLCLLEGGGWRLHRTLWLNEEEAYVRQFSLNHAFWKIVSYAFTEERLAWKIVFQLQTGRELLFPFSLFGSEQMHGAPCQERKEWVGIASH